MLDIEDLEIIVKELEESKNDRVNNIVKRLNILIAQDKENTEFRKKMDEYTKQLNELVKDNKEPIEK